MKRSTASFAVPSASPSPSGAPADPGALPAYTFEVLSLEEIRKLMRSESKPDVARAVRAIEKLSDPKLRKELLLELSTSKHDDIRYQCLAYLAGIGDRDCVVRLQQALSSDIHPGIRRNAAAELGKLGGDGTVELLLKNANDDNLHVRVDVAASLNQLGHPGAAADLIPRFTSDLDSPDGSVREDAVENLSSLRSPLALPALIRATRDRSGDVRFAAVRGLQVLGTPDVVPVLQTLMKDPVSDVVDAAKDALEAIEKKK